MKTMCPPGYHQNSFVETSCPSCRLASVRFEHSVCRGSLITTYAYIYIYIYIYYIFLYI